MWSANIPEEEKMQVIGGTSPRVDDIHLPHQQVIKDAEAHLHLATQERSYYSSVIDTCKEVLEETFTVNGQLQVPSIDARLLPVMFNIIMHSALTWINKYAAH